MNTQGILGKIYSRQIEHFKSEHIKFVHHDKIDEIACGIAHCLAISKENKLFGWGSNLKFQLGLDNIEFSSIPREITKFNKLKIKFIYSQNNVSALATSEQVHIWGEIKRNFNILQPVVISILNPVKICYPYFLDNDGFIWFMKYSDRETMEYHFFKLNDEETFIDDIQQVKCYLKTESTLHWYSSRTFYVSDELCYELFNENSSMVSKLSLRNFIWYEMQIISELLTKNFHDNIDTSVKNWNNDFESITKIDQGAFGVVYKIKYHDDEKFYAMKEIAMNFKQEKNLTPNEWIINSKLNSNYIVKCHDHFHRNRKFFIIIMEFCDNNLKNILNFKTQFFDELIEYNEYIEYIFNIEILIEIIEGIKYLHENNPPIIHRDLKPTNILVNYLPSESGNFLKIGDFGISTMHENSHDKHTQNVGTYSYQAPEIGHGQDYNTKSDIYSLGVIAKELFQINYDSYVASDDGTFTYLIWLILQE